MSETVSSFCFSLKREANSVEKQRVRERPKRKNDDGSRVVKRKSGLNIKCVSILSARNTETHIFRQEEGKQTKRETFCYFADQMYREAFDETLK